MKNKRKSIIIVCSAIFLILIIGISIYAVIAKPAPLAEIVSDIKSSQCKKLAIELLQVKNVAFKFNRCEQHSYKLSDGGKSIKRVYVVAGEVDRHWEFECGFNLGCAKYVGWFDEDDKLFDFVDMPETASLDPAVYTLGCGDVNSRSFYDVEIKPKLVFERSKYWWRVDYDGTPISTQANVCNVSGISMIGFKEVLSSVKAEYLFDTDTCAINTPTLCQTAKALKTASVESCKYSSPAYDISKPAEDTKVYDYVCTSNYIAQTGDTTLCGKEANYGKINCKNIVTVKQL